ncbi:hypothetical protein [Pseudonocardia thermophila]|uniref:hypothetical protein n=1 Tax=Pseudonocardia thermophila TaxID=1848 RepID=UPI00248EA1A3|nr:hypothetical protein [Pseudonocardia thermophila]
MRRIITIIGSLAAAGLLALVVPGSAHAADGVLIINGVAYAQPSGCYHSHRWPLVVDNRADEYATIYAGPFCEGEQLAYVHPGERAVSPLGSSVYIP